MKKFVILTTQRTGSTLLVRSFDKHKKVLLSGEIFLNGDGIHHAENQFPFINVKYFSKRINRILNIPLMVFKYKSFVRNYYKKSEQQGYKASGFKLMLSQMKYLPGFLGFLEKEQIYPIVLVRKDVVANVFSSVIAKTTGNYHLTNERSVGQQVKSLFIDPTIFETRLGSVEKTNVKLNEISTRFSNSLLLHYEDFSNWHHTIEKICDYLDVDYAEVDQALIKINTNERYADVITNYNQLKVILEKKGYSL